MTYPIKSPLFVEVECGTHRVLCNSTYLCVERIVFAILLESQMTSFFFFLFFSSDTNCSFRSPWKESQLKRKKRSRKNRRKSLPRRINKIRRSILCGTEEAKNIFEYAKFSSALPLYVASVSPVLTSSRSPNPFLLLSLLHRPRFLFAGLSASCRQVSGRLASATSRFRSYT